MSADGGPLCELVELTPEMAAQMLKTNVRNRPLVPAHVKRLADAMRAGEWELNGEPIQIADDGTLLNGQHRLMAVLDANVTIPALVVSGLGSDAFRTLDAGQRRRLSDVLALRGEVDTTNLSATLGLLHRYRKGVRMDVAGATAPSAQQALDLLEREPEVRDALRRSGRLRSHNQMRLSVMAVLMHLFDEANPGEGTRFFEELCRVHTDPKSPLRALRSILERGQRDRTYRPPVYSLCAMTIKAFNAWIDGTPMTILLFRPSGETPEPFPKIRRANPS